MGAAQSALMRLQIRSLASQSKLNPSMRRLARCVAACAPAVSRSSGRHRPRCRWWEAKTLASTRLAKEVTNVDVDTYYVSGSRGMSGGVGTTTSFLDFAREAELPQMYRSDQTVCGQCERRKPP